MLMWLNNLSTSMIKPQNCGKFDLKTHYRRSFIMICKMCGSYTDINYGTPAIDGIFCEACWEKIIYGNKKDFKRRVVDKKGDK